MVTDDEIKNAYRKLAKKYHPDSVEGNEERFKDIGEAYQVLGTAKSKKRYNIRYYLHIFQNGIYIGDFKETLTRFGNSEFAKIFIGEYTDIKPKEDESKAKKGDFDEELTIQLSLEEAFNGATKQISYRNEDGQTRQINVKVPRGATNGSILSLSGKGRKDKKSSEQGDLHIKIELIRDKTFELKGYDLIRKVAISPSDAALGCEKSVESLDGIYKLKVPSGAQNNDTISIKEAGYINKDGKRGDLLANLIIEVPKELSEAEKELYNKLKALQK